MKHLVSDNRDRLLDPLDIRAGNVQVDYEETNNGSSVQVALKASGHGPGIGQGVLRGNVDEQVEGGSQGLGFKGELGAVSFGNF